MGCPRFAGLAAILALAAAAGWPGKVKADTGAAANEADDSDPSEQRRPWHGELMVGGTLALTGPIDYGGQAVLSLSPGGPMERFGVRLSARSFETESEGFLALGVAFEAAASRPRLALGLFAEAGPVSGEADAVIGAGIHTTLSIIGPLAVSTDVAAHVFLDGVESRLGLSGSLLLGLSR